MTISINQSGHCDSFAYDGLNRLVFALLDDVDDYDIGDAMRLACRYNEYGNRRELFWDVEDVLSSSWYATTTGTASKRLTATTYDRAGNVLDLHGDTFTWYPLSFEEHKVPGWLRLCG